MPSFYRVKQLWWAVTARPLSAESEATVKSVLNSAELTLFRQFSHGDQQHGLRVLQNLSNSDRQSLPLAKAALIHDVGKTRLTLTVLDRCLIVLASRVVPARARDWGRDPAAQQRYKRAFVIREWHAAWGAEMAEAVGSDQLTCDLIRRHQDKLSNVQDATEKLLLALQTADDKS